MEEGRIGEGRGEGEEEGKEGAQEIIMHGATDRIHTHAHTQIPIIPFILPASSYCAWGCRDLADRAENKPPFPHLPESSEEQTKQRAKHILTKTGNISEYVITYLHSVPQWHLNPQYSAGV